MKMNFFVMIFRKKIALFFLLAISGNQTFAAQPAVFLLNDSILSLQRTYAIAWKFHAGDNPQWAQQDFDDSRWDTLNCSLPMDAINPNLFTGICWFRLTLQVDSSLRGKSVFLQLNQQGASEIYFNGSLAGTWGKVSAIKEREERYHPHGAPVHLQLNNEADQLLAIRYSNHRAQQEFEKFNHRDAGFNFKFSSLKNATTINVNSVIANTTIFIFLFGFFSALSLLHFLLFLFYRKQKLNLYYALFMEGVAAVFLMIFIVGITSSPEIIAKFGFTSGAIVVPYFFVALLGMYYSFFYKPMPKRFWIGAGVMAAYIPFCFYKPLYALDLVALIMFVVFFEIIRVVIISIAKKRAGAWILGTGVLFFIASLTAITLYAIFFGAIMINSETTGGVAILLLIILAILSIPIATSVFLAWDFSRINRGLELQLVQIKELSEKTLRQEQEKKRILETQKEHLETEVNLRTAEVIKQKEEIEGKNKEITDSINYAKRIQAALLPVKEHIRASLPESFVFYQPKDIVSGDFYWFYTKEEKIFIAVCDCTGHGVPGALMSMIGNSMLNQAAGEKQLEEPGDILSEVNRNIRHALKQSATGAESRDGMDIVFCSIENNPGSTILRCAGAHRPLWIMRNSSKKIEEISPDKTSLGGLTEDGYKFITQTIQINTGDSIYLFTDGYADQFGGEKGKKMMSRKFRELLESLSDKNMTEQEKILHEEFNRWKGIREQVDDVLVIGIRF